MNSPPLLAATSPLRPVSHLAQPVERKWDLPRACGDCEEFQEQTLLSNWQHGRKLLKPEVVTALPDRVAIKFTPGVPPSVRDRARPGWAGSTQAQPPLRQRDPLDRATRTRTAERGPDGTGNDPAGARSTRRRDPATRSLGMVSSIECRQKNRSESAIFADSSDELPRFDARKRNKEKCSSSCHYACSASRYSSARVAR